MVGSIVSRSVLLCTCFVVNFKTSLALVVGYLQSPLVLLYSPSLLRSIHAMARWYHLISVMTSQATAVPASGDSSGHTL